MSRKSIHLTEKTEKHIISRHTGTDKTPNWSGSINAAFDMLAHLAAAEKPNLSAAEWAELYNVYSGSDFKKTPLPLNLAADLLKHHGATLPRELPQCCLKLVETLADLTQAQQYAAIDNVRRFLSSV